MNDAAERYGSLLKRLVFTRWVNRGLDSTEEDSILDEMDVVWGDLTEAEKAFVNAQPTQSLILAPDPPSLPRLVVDCDLSIEPRGPPRQLVEVA